MICYQIPTSVAGLIFLMGLTSASLFSQTTSPPPPSGSLVTYTSFEGTTYTLREFNGLYVAILIDDAQIAVAGEAFVRRQIDRYDQTYDALKDFLGSEPSGSGLLRIAVIPDQGQAGDGIIGAKGCEITHSFFDDPNLLGRDLLYEVVKHEMIHNFDQYSTYFFTAPDPFHSWTDFMQPYAGFYLQEGFTDQSLVAPEDWLRIITDRFFSSYLSFPGHSWANCVQSSACDGGEGGMAQHAQGGVALRVSQIYGPKAMKSWYPVVRQMSTSRNLSPNTMTDGDKVDFLFETLSNAVGDNLSCFADSVQWPISAPLRARLSTLPMSSYCDDQDHDGYSPLQGDFNDNNATVHPGAPEAMDGLDNDLNGAVDEVLVSESSPFPNQIANALLVPWPVRITGALTSGTGTNADDEHFFRISVATTVNLRFQLKNTGNFNGYIQIYNSDGSGYSSEYVSSFFEPTDLTLTFTPGEWRFSVSFGASGGPGTYELVVGQALPRVDPLLFAGPPIHEPSGAIRLSMPQVPRPLISRSTEVRFWVSGFGWVGSSPVPGSGSPFFDWTPPSGVDLSGLRYTIQYFNDGLRSSAATPGVPVLPPACSFAIEPMPINVPASGGSAKLSVATSVGCSWQIAADSPWIALAGDSGPLGNNNGTGPPLGWESGNGSINVYASANTGPQARTAALTIAGQNISISQPAPAIGVSISSVTFAWTPGNPAPAAQTVIVSNGGSGALTWSATASLPWIVVSPRSGSAPSVPAFTVSVDTSAKAIQMPGTYSGNVAVAAAGGSISSVSVTLTVVPSMPAPAVSITNVLNGASGTTGIENGSWVSVYGANLSATARTWQASDFEGNDLPTALDGVSVMINGKSAAVYFVSPGQLNIQAPTDSVTGSVSVRVTNSYGSATATTTLQPYSPAFFPEGEYVAAVHSDGVYVAPPGYFGSAIVSRPAQSGEILSLYGTGFGPTMPAVPAGQIVNGAAPLSDLTILQISIGGLPAAVKFAGIVAAGEYQFNVVIPPLPNGDQPITATIGGTSTQLGLLIAVNN